MRVDYTRGPNAVDRFFHTLNYSSVNEDWRTEAGGLHLSATDRVLCVTGSGERALSLLAAAPVEVTAIDLNPVQNHLLSLKVASLRVLPYQEHVAFLGFVDADLAWRRRLYRELAADLPARSSRFWDDHQSAVARGVLYQGRWERFYRRTSRLLSLVFPALVRRLFAFEDLEAQRRFVDESWDSRSWRAAFRLICSRAVSRRFLGDPAYLAGPGAGLYLHERMGHLLRRCLANRSFMVSLALRGHLAAEDLPPSLTREGQQLIRARLAGLDLLDSDLTAHLRNGGRGRYNRFSLSDVPSFLDQEGFEDLIEAISAAAPDGGRFVIRQFLTRQTVPERFTRRLARDAELESRLAERDRSFAYQFLCGEVVRG